MTMSAQNLSYSIAVGTLLLMFFLYSVESEDSYCSYNLEPNVEGVLSFSKPPATLSIACSLQIHRMHCCMQNYKQITWWKQDNTTKKWISTDELRNEIYPDPLTKNQSLIIENPGRTWDAALYRCMGKNGTDQNISNTIKLRVEDCTTWTQPPVRLIPNTSSVVVKRLPGSSVNFNCRGFYGKLEPADLIYWEYRGNPLCYPTPPPTIKCIEENTLNNNGKDSILEIVNITTEDYGIYSCHMYNGYPPHVVVNFTLELGDPNPHPPEDPTYKHATIGVVCVVVLIFGSMGVIYYNRIEIQLFTKDRFLRTKRKEGTRNDAYVIFDEECREDRAFVFRKLRPLLEETLNYTILIPPRDFRIGEFKADEIAEAVASSHCLIFIVSPCMVRDPWCQNVFHQAFATSHFNRLYIRFRSLDDFDWPDELRSIRAAIRTGHHAKWATDGNTRKEARFWKKVRLYFPAPKSETSSTSDEAMLTGNDRSHDQEDIQLNEEDLACICDLSRNTENTETNGRDIPTYHTISTDSAYNSMSPNGRNNHLLSAHDPGNEICAERT